MIAQCRFCQAIIHPLLVLPIKPAQLAKIPPEQVEVMKFSGGITEHIRETHPEYIGYVQGLAGTFLGHCMVAAVEVAGDGAEVFRVLTAHDAAMCRESWEAVPNPPHPDTVAQLQGEAQAQLKMAMEAGAAAQAPAPAPIVPPPPGKITLN